MNNVTYTAELSNEGLLIYISRRAGICGPGPSVGKPANLAAADAWLEEKGFRRVEDWTVSEYYGGMMLSAKLTEI